MSSIAWKLRLAMLALAAVAVAGVIMVRAVLGDGLAGWLAILTLTSIVLFAIGFLLERAEGNTAAAQGGELLDRAVDQGRIRLEDLFDDKYQPIGNTRPQKFKTRFDDFFDLSATPLQESLVEQYRWLVYGICCDRRGYVPTHNKRFSQPLTGDKKADFVNNRTKRIFDDPVGRRCGSLEQPFLLQTYRRDTGEIMHDIPAVIYVKGKHWGGFRIGYRTEM